jgi:hypothetical protein
MQRNLDALNNISHFEGFRTRIFLVYQWYFITSRSVVFSTSLVIPKDTPLFLPAIGLLGAEFTVTSQAVLTDISRLSSSFTSLYKSQPVVVSFIVIISNLMFIPRAKTCCVVSLTSVLPSTAIETHWKLVAFIFKFTWMLFECSSILRPFVNPYKRIFGNAVFLSGHAKFVTDSKHYFIISPSVKGFIVFS